MKYKVILFDLDGTISDPKVGITKSVQFALSKMGIEENNLDILECFIGPPLQVSFKDYYSFNPNETLTAIEYYRDRFKLTGMYENTLYEGIPTLLEDLRKQGYKLVIATSKPTVFSEEIVRYFNLEHFFDLNVGSNLDGTRSSKAEIIQYIVERFNNYSLKDFIMIGDRKYDIIGANTIGIDSIGVTYGYGAEKELQDAKPTHILKSVKDLEVFFHN
ncbi:phosphoglycolate phosphatase [Bacillus mesophilus]|nr:phosphoglycolate phosphatase [Bacillus mesophilus]